MSESKNFESGSEHPQMSPEDFAEMMDQVPLLKKMVEERKQELETLEQNQNSDTRRITQLRTEIAELNEEIKNREDVEGGE